MFCARLDQGARDICRSKAFLSTDILTISPGWESKSSMRLVVLRSRDHCLS